MNRLDCSLIIHGPLHVNTIFTVYKYLHDYKIIICCPKPENKKIYSILKEIRTLTDLEDSDISLIVYNNILDELYNNNQNRYFHFSSVDSALQLCNTKYSVKIRSDEFYSNLSFFFNEINKNESKIITNDVFFRKSESYPLHPSDHLVGGTTKLLKKVFNLSKNLCESVDELNNNVIVKSKLNGNNNLTPEQVLGCAAVTTIVDKKNIENLNSQELMKMTFHIVKSTDLGFYIITSNTIASGVTYFDNSYFDVNIDINDIDKYV